MFSWFTPQFTTTNQTSWFWQLSKSRSLDHTQLKSKISNVSKHDKNYMYAFILIKQSIKITKQTRKLKKWKDQMRVYTSLHVWIDLAKIDPTRKPDPNPPENSGFWTWFSQPEPEINRTRETLKILGQTQPGPEPARLTRILYPYF